MSVSFNNLADLTSSAQFSTPSKLKPLQTESLQKGLDLNEKLSKKQKVTALTIDTLDGSYDGSMPRGREICGLTMRMQHCIDNSNLFIAEDLHNRETGECFDGSGSLWACSSRFCAFCVGKPSKENRKKIRYVMQNAKLLVGEHWYFPTFTMPDLAVGELPLPLIAEIKQTAWGHFTHCETNEKKSKTWFQEHFRGGFKNCEFTISDYETYHYHLHALMIGSYKIQRNNFVEIRSAWTKSLKFAFQKHGVDWQCGTKDGLAVVNVEKVDFSNHEKVINELCKYVTKSDSWSKIPDAQLLEIASMARFWRMFESFGVCRQIVRQSKENVLKCSEKAVILLLHLLSNLNGKTYLDTTNLIPSVFSLISCNFANAPPKRKKRSWFLRLKEKEITLFDYQAELKYEISKAVNFRKLQLRRMYPFAVFRDLNGWEF